MIKVKIEGETVVVDSTKVKYDDFLILKTHNFNIINKIDQEQSYSNNFEIFNEFILKVAYQEKIDINKIDIDNISFINLDLKFFCLPSLLDIKDNYISKIANVLKMLFIKYLGDDGIYDNYIINKISFKKSSDKDINTFINAFIPIGMSTGETLLIMDLNSSYINKNDIIIDNDICTLSLYGSYGDCKNFYAESEFRIEHMSFKKIDKNIYIDKIKIVETLGGKKYDHIYDGIENGFFDILISNIISAIIHTKDVCLEINNFERHFTNYFCIKDVIVEMKII